VVGGLRIVRQQQACASRRQQVYVGVTAFDASDWGGRLTALRVVRNDRAGHSSDEGLTLRADATMPPGRAAWEASSFPHQELPTVGKGGNPDRSPAAFILLGNTKHVGTGSTRRCPPAGTGRHRAQTPAKCNSVALPECTSATTNRDKWWRGERRDRHGDGASVGTTCEPRRFEHGCEFAQ
jgi:hypothetical protein